MTYSNVPTFEADRLRALHQIQLLDTPAEERFDRIARLARRVCSVPIAMINFVDLDRVWSKSCLGVAQSESPRETTFCAYTVSREQPLVVEDTHADDRFIHFPIVTDDPTIRFYAGYPLRSTEGYRIGTLCVFDQQPRVFSNEDLHLLGDLAELAEREIAAIEMNEVWVERQRAETAIMEDWQQLRQVIEATPVGIAMFDTGMRYIAHSTTWLEMVRRQGSNLIGQSQFDALPYLPPRWRTLYDRALHGETLSNPEERIDRQDGTIDYLKWTMTPWYTSPGVVGGIVIVSDYVNALVEAREAAIEATETKSNFLAMMSHEIRTPMTGIIGMTELLLLSPLTNEQHQYATIVHQSAHNLLTIINDILDFSKIEAGKLTINPVDFDLQTVVESATNVVKLKAGEQRIDLHVSYQSQIPPRLHGDPDRLRQILLNLLSNAVKFTHQGGVRVDISAELATATSVTLHVSVADTGIGLSEAACQRLFQPFTQADSSTTRKYGGSGLGLSITKQLVEMMGGTIGAESREGHGSRFWFAVPLAHATSQAHHPLRDAVSMYSPVQSPRLPSPMQTSDGSGGVLVVDDVAVNRTLVLHQLHQLGIRGDAVSNGHDALIAVRSGDYALVLMDCQMSEMDGYETTRKIREMEADYLLPHGTGIPIVAMTANALAGAREACIAAGMDDYLPKPFTIEELRARLASWLPPAFFAPAEQTDPMVSGQGAVEGSPLDPKKMDQLRRMSGDDTNDLLNELIRMYITESSPMIAELRTAIAQRDHTIIKEVAHRLAGMSGNFGAAALVTLCQTVEQKGRDRISSELDVLFARLETEHIKVQEALKQIGADQGTLPSHS